MKLTTEEKRYRKSVIFGNEIKMLQGKINSLGLTQPLTIKKLYFDYNKSQNDRTVCLSFKETFTVTHSITKKKEKVNKWASVNFVFDSSGTKHNGLIISNVFCSGGCRYKDSNNDIEDDDIRKVCEMLANEYFLWLHWTDHHVFQDIEMSKRRAEAYGVNVENYIKDDYPICQYFMQVMWKRMDIGFNGRYTQYLLTEMIKKYNEQVERGLIVDSPFENGKFPFNEIKCEEITDNEVKRAGLYG